MALPILVPAGGAEGQDGWLTQRGNPIRQAPASGISLRKADFAVKAPNQPSAREEMITRWRRVCLVTWAGQGGKKVRSCPSGPTVKDATQEDLGIDLMGRCEWLLRRQLRLSWRRLCRGGRAQVLAEAKRFNRDEPVVEASTMAADAAAWTLFAMYWWGVSHPLALFNEALHPPTGLVQWVSQFHVDQQRTRPVEIQRLLVRHLGVTQGRCEVLVRRMVKRTGQVALLREVCDF